MNINVDLSLLTFRNLFEGPYISRKTEYPSPSDYYSRARARLEMWPSLRLFQHFLVFPPISHHCSQVPSAKPFLQRNKTSAFKQCSKCTNLRV